MSWDGAWKSAILEGPQVVCGSHYEKHCGLQPALPKVRWPYCPRCGPALPASCGNKNPVTVLSSFGLSTRRAEKQNAIFHFQPCKCINNSAQVKLTQNSAYEFKRKSPTSKNEISQPKIGLKSFRLQN